MSAISERRTIHSTSVAGAGRTIRGYAARFDTPTIIGGQGGFVETIRKGAFARAIRERQDVRALVNHDPSKIVGRTGNGSLRLTEDGDGLAFVCDVADTTTGDDLMELLRTQTISECSFGFKVPTNGDRWSQIKHDGQMRDCRELLDLDLFDVSAVTFPAYPSTSVDLVTAAMAATASASSSMPAELRSRIRTLVTSQLPSLIAMNDEELSIYTRALLLEAEAALDR